MAEWSAGYVADVAYSHGYYRELHPRFLALCALNQGVLVPGLAGEKLRVLELGCGQGFAANLIAAANPEIDYRAVDFMPQHVLGARALAGGRGNIRFSDADFAALAEEPAAEDYDLISLHGVYSWVPAAARAQILRIAARRLKPGGLLYLSYNTHPGWSAFMPVQRLLRDAATDLPRAGLKAQLDFAFAQFRRLGEVGARFLDHTPELQHHISDLETQSPSYLAHEYLNADWEVFHFADVAAQLAEAKLSYLGSAHPIEQIDSLNLTEAQIALLAETPDPTRRESLRDLIVDRAFRRDIFVKGAVTRSQDALRAIWLGLRFTLGKPRAAIPEAVQGPLDKVALQPALHGALLDALADGPRELAEALHESGLQDADWTRLREALVLLVGAGHIHICPPPGEHIPRAESCQAFNTVVMEQSRFSEDCRYLASPVTGAEVAVDRYSQLFLLARRAASTDPTAETASFMARHGQRLMRDGEILSGEAEMAEALGRHETDIFRSMLPFWTRLGIA